MPAKKYDGRNDVLRRLDLFEMAKYNNSVRGKIDAITSHLTRAGIEFVASVSEGMVMIPSSAVSFMTLSGVKIQEEGDLAVIRI